MLPTQTKPVVLARFPVGRDTRHRISDEGARLHSSGRIFDQAFSFKLLSSVALLVVVVAVVPWFFHNNNRVSTDSDVKESFSAWQTSRAETPPEAAPVVVAAVPQAPLAPAPAPSPKSDNAKATTAAAEPRMSAWPNPSHPIASPSDGGNALPRVDANRAMAIQPAEYNRSSHDSTRPSLH